jgi:hypothetical protein
MSIENDENDPAFVRERADRIYAEKLLLKFRDVIGAVVDGLEDERDRVYFGSSNHADALREVHEEIESIEWDRIQVKISGARDLYAEMQELNEKIRRAREALS